VSPKKFSKIFIQAMPLKGLKGRMGQHNDCDKRHGTQHRSLFIALDGYAIQHADYGTGFHAADYLQSPES
jgi:hypothetical protein